MLVSSLPPSSSSSILLIVVIALVTREDESWMERSGDDRVIIIQRIEQACVYSACSLLQISDSKDGIRSRRPMDVLQCGSVQYGSATLR